MNLHEFKDQVVLAVATAGILGGGGTLISAKIELGRHDERIARIEALSEDMDTLRQELVETRLALEPLREKHEQEPGVR